MKTRDAQKQQKVMLRAALLLVEDELRNAADGAASILQNQPYAPFPTVAGDDNSIRLAGELLPEEWRVLAQAYDRVHGFNWRHQANVLTDDEVRKTVCGKIVADAGAARQLLTARLDKAGVSPLR